jgi:hypothetical protein
LGSEGKHHVTGERGLKGGGAWNHEPEASRKGRKIR